MVAGGIKHRNNESEGPAYIGDSKPKVKNIKWHNMETLLTTAANYSPKSVYQRTLPFGPLGSTTMKTLAAHCSPALQKKVLEALKDHQTKINQKGNDKERLNIKLGTSEKYALHKFLCPGEDGKYCYITIVLERKIFWPNTYDDLAEGRLKGDPMDIRLDKY
eukprot:Platyproteum_vivax@DN1897_c0_g1_i1.p1